MKKRIKCIGLLVAGCWIGGNICAEILYQDDFSGSSTVSLNTQTPDVTMNGNKWVSAGSQPWYADGHIDLESGWVRTAYLAFTPSAGKVYTLSVDINPLGNTTGWIGFGFCGTGVNAGASLATDATGASPWAFMQADRAKAGTYPGIALLGGVGKYPVDFPGSDWTGVVNMKIVLDTTGDSWTASWYVNNVNVRTYTYTGGNPAISNVAFSRNGATAAIIEKFELSEGSPKTLSLVTFSGIGN